MIRQRIALLALLLAFPLASWGSNPPPDPQPCCQYRDWDGCCIDENNGPCPDCLFYMQGAAQGAGLTPANSPSSGSPESGGGSCPSCGGAAGGGEAPLFQADIGIDALGSAGFSLPLGGAARPGGMGGGRLFFQVKALAAGSLPLDALQYSLAPAKPVLLPDGRIVRIDVRNDRHDYAAHPGSSLLLASSARDRTTVRLVDSQGQPATSAPASIDVVNPYGDAIRFRVGDTNLPAVAALPEYSIYNRKLDLWRVPGDQGISVTRDGNGILTEIVTPSAVTRITSTNAWSFDVTVYPPEIRQQTLVAVLPIVTYRVEGEPTNAVHFTSGRSMSITELRPGYTNVSVFTYTPLNERWTLTQGNGERRLSRFETWDSPARNYQIRTLELRDSASRLLSHREDICRSLPWGLSTVSTAIGTGTCVIVTSNDFYTTSSQPGSYGQLKNIVRSTGDWTIYDYDVRGRRVQELHAWKNMPFASATSNNCRMITYDYGADPTNPWPLCTTESIEGQMVSRTFNTNTANVIHPLFASVGYLVQAVTERAASPGSAQGSVSNLVSTELDNGSAGDAASQGALRASIRPDGTMDNYAYDYGTFNGTNDPCFTPGAGTWHRTMLTHCVTASPAGVAFKTTHEITVRNPKGQVVFEETQVYDGSAYQRMSYALHTCDGAGHRVRSDYSDGTFRAWDYAPGRLVSFTDRDGTVTTYAYDILGRVSDTVRTGVAPYGDYAGQTDRTTTRLYDAQNRLVTEIARSGDLSLGSSRNYDILGRLVQQTDPAQLVTQYGYSSDGTVRTVTLPSGLMRATVNYPSGQARSVTEDGTLKSVSDYNINGDGTRWTSVWTGPAGTNSPMWQKTTTDFLSRTVRVEKPGFGGVVLTNAFFYNAIGQLVRSASPSAPDTLYVYDSLGQQYRSGLDGNGNGALDLVGPDRVTETARRYVNTDDGWMEQSVSMLYADASGSPLTNAVTRASVGGVSCRCAATKTVSIDILGNATVTMTSLDPAHRLVTRRVLSPTSTNADVTVTFNGLTVRHDSSAGVRADYAYDSLGRQVLAATGAGGRFVATVTHYNALGKVDWTQDGASNQTSYAYDQAGRRVGVTDALSNTTYTAYDDQSRVVGTWGATYPVAYDYDDFGRMVAMYTYRGTNAISFFSDISNLKLGMDRTAWLYDLATGLLTNKVYADGKGPSYAYTPDGKLASRTWARGIVSAYGYDTLGKLTSIAYSDGTPGVAFSFDRLGRQVVITDGTGTRRFVYNDALQLACETNAFGVLTRNYDALGRSAGFSLDSAYSVAYGYDPVGRFASVSSSVQSVSSVVTYSYLPGSDLIAGWSNDAGLAVARAYEPNRDLIVGVSNTFNDLALPSFAYGNDALGRRVNRVDSIGTANSFGYNTRNELVEASMGTNQYGYAYDPIGNRITSTISNQTYEIIRYAVNALNQYTNISDGGVVEPSYDSDGNLTNYAGWTFVWDAENRLVGAMNGVTVVSNAYDYMSRRVSKTANGLTRQFTYDGWAMIRESSATTNLYVYGLDLSGSLQGAGTICGLLCASLNGTTAFYVYDANGNVSDLVDAGGNSLAHYEYDPYGNTTAMLGALAVVNPFRLSTKYADSETGLYYYSLRFYSPMMGRWTSRDPVGERGGLNLASFVGGDPVGRWDSLGLDFIYIGRGSAGCEKFCLWRSNETGHINATPNPPCNPPHEGPIPQPTPPEPTPPPLPPVPEPIPPLPPPDPPAPESGGVHVEIGCTILCEVACHLFMMPEPFCLLGCLATCAVASPEVVN